MQPKPAPYKFTNFKLLPHEAALLKELSRRSDRTLIQEVRHLIRQEGIRRARQEEPELLKAQEEADAARLTQLLNAAEAEALQMLTKAPAEQAK